MQTPPLLLRPWSTDDAPALRAAIDESLDALRPFITWAADEPATLEQTRTRLARYAAEFAGASRWRYAVVHRETGELLGGASLHPYPGPGALEVGYWVRSSRTRRGIAGAAAAALARHALDAHAVERVEIWCDPENAASRLVARSLGFSHAGRHVTHRADGSPRVVEVFRITSRDELRVPAGDVVIEP
ncbi:GNAT family N-acetyltransferase [Longimicrobium sp.]|uniref:GNAT family N-acetyltransferase n=1 Tax=Longimicrobium sp. TaxID=2029185 RepID=UPI003B3B255F